jgi:hypothetical protein
MALAIALLCLLIAVVVAGANFFSRGRYPVPGDATANILGVLFLAVLIVLLVKDI